MRDLRSHATAVVIGLTAISRAAGATTDPQDFTQIERGRYLSDIGDCGACHTLPGSGHRFAGGRSIETPFGRLIAPNITPDPETGIGAWTDEEFVNALTKGTGRNGTHLYPAMPYTYMTRLTEPDALAIRAYFNTIPAVRNAVQVNQLPFPFDIREGMEAWNKLNFGPGQFIPRADKSASWNRGAYLVEGPAHCGLCHTPKNVTGGDETSRRLRGNVVQGWFAPDITNDSRRGLGSWSVEEIVNYLETGHNATAAATGPMAEVVTDSTSKMTTSDVHAIAEYLKDQPGETDGPQSPPNAGVMNLGAAIYADECAACHASTGTGLEGMFPSLKGSPSVQSVDPASLLRVVLRGARSAATDAAPTAPAMPSFGWLLTDDQVAAVITYVRNAWGNKAAAVDAGTVNKTRHALIERND